MSEGTVETVREYTTDPVYLILDGHPAHKAKTVKTFVASTKGRLKLCVLPAYSPLLKPPTSGSGRRQARPPKPFRLQELTATMTATAPTIDASHLPSALTSRCSSHPDQSIRHA
jgi:hypothetical protein